MSENTKQPIQLKEAVSDDEVLNYSQRLRRGLVDAMTENGTSFPEDTKDRYALLTALSDMDRTAIQNKKIGSVEREGAADRAAAVALAKVIQLAGGNNPFVGKTIHETPREIPVLDESNLEELTMVPGETAIGISSETYTEFMSRMEKDDDSENEA